MIDPDDIAAVAADFEDLFTGSERWCTHLRSSGTYDAAHSPISVWGTVSGSVACWVAEVDIRAREMRGSSAGERAEPLHSQVSLAGSNDVRVGDRLILDTAEDLVVRYMSQGKTLRFSTIASCVEWREHE